MFRKLDLFPSSGQGSETPTLWGQVIEVSFRSHEDGNRSSFRNAVISSSLEFRTMDKVLKPSDSEWWNQEASETGLFITEHTRRYP
jgi:hypothetical protein